MSKRDRQKKKIIELLEDIPNICIVCDKAGVPRSTYYRWRREDIGFREQTNEAEILGRESINDLAESALIAGIKDGNFKFLKYWLDHNHKKYSKNPESISCPLIKEEQGLTAEQIEKIEWIFGHEEEKYQARKKCQECKESSCENG